LSIPLFIYSKHAVNEIYLRLNNSISF